MEIISSRSLISTRRFTVSVMLVCALILWSRTLTHANIGSVVCIADGCLQGNTLSGGVYAFLGVPYAAPPTGDHRFRPPADPVPWPGVKAATAFGPICPRLATTGAVNGNEDCLTLDVWAPAVAESPVPVIVFIHPGLSSRGMAASGTAAYGAAAFQTTWDGQPWAANGIVFVSVEWRVNALGFLAHPALSAEDPQGSSGNYGVLDQIAALRWVHNNIRDFGGNPDNVTILGSTGGAADASVLVVSDLANGLFRHAILESPIWSRFPTLLEAEDGVAHKLCRASAVQPRRTWRGAYAPNRLGTLSGPPPSNRHRPRARTMRPESTDGFSEVIPWILSRVIWHRTKPRSSLVRLPTK